MPELPEVETIVRELQHLVGKTFRGFRLHNTGSLKGRLADFFRALQNRRLEALSRRGKYICFHLAGGLTFTIHLRMTGKLLWTLGEKDRPYVRAEFRFDDGSQLFFIDVRKFGRIVLWNGRRALLPQLGPEPLQAAEVLQVLEKLITSRPIKSVLLDQTVLAGVGNIYADEGLFRAGVHPRTPAGRLSRAKRERLSRALPQVLNAAIQRRGTSLSDYRTPDNRRGQNQEHLRVYGREGLPCPRCGRIIKKERLVGRSLPLLPFVPAVAVAGLKKGCGVITISFLKSGANMNQKYSGLGRKKATCAIWLVVLAIIPFVLGEGRVAAQVRDTGLGPAARVNPVLYRQGEVLVKFRKGISSIRLRQEPGLSVVRDILEFRVLSRRSNKTYALLRSFLMGTDQLLDWVARMPQVEAVSPNYAKRLLRVPNDPKWPKLWGLPIIKAPEAWDSNVGSPDVAVGVIDTGVDYTHEDLLANIWVNPGEVANNGIDDDHNGYVDDVNGYDFAHDSNGSNSPDPMDIDGHGTHVAGIIAAVGDNGLGTCGVGWVTKIVAIKAFRPDLYIYDSDEIEAIEYAIVLKTFNHINLVAVNASFGGSTYNSLEQDAIGELEKAGIIFVAAAGNDGSNNDTTPEYPASFGLPNIIAVAASDSNDQLASFSNYGVGSVDLAAPGVHILSTFPMGQGSETALLSGATTYETEPLEYAGWTLPGGITAHAYPCGRGIQASDFPPQVNGSIALIERGDITFHDKVLNAQNAGAIGAIIYNNVPGLFSGTLQTPGSWIPVLSLSQADGQQLVAMGAPLVTLIHAQGNYEYLDGTSMAAPFVTGALALLAAQSPQDNYRQRIGRILGGVDTLASLNGMVASGGRLNVAQSLALDIGVALYVSREQAKGWIVRRDYAVVTFSLDLMALSQIPGGKFQVMRMAQGGSFAVIKEIAASEGNNGNFFFVDKYLDHATRYTYQIVVRNNQGAKVGVSNELTI